MNSAVLDWDATELSAKIMSGEVSSLEATETYIQHLKHINPQLNGLVEDRFEAARQEAMLCDSLYKEGKAKGKLFGVPISVKESFHIKGMKTTGGLIHRIHQIEQIDAYIVRRLKEEGAIILGKSNTPTLCFCQESENKLYGRTNNPWDLSRTAGGSSGGEAALIGAGGAAVGVGSDIGGSIRFPSHFNGVIGFKSGNSQVSQEGHFPFVTHPLQESMLGIGAIAKSVQDAKLINDIITYHPLPDCHLTHFEICIPDIPSIPLGEDTQHLLQRISIDLQKDFSVKKSFPFDLKQIMSIDAGKGIADLAFEKDGSRFVREYVKEVLFGSSAYHRYLTWALIGASLFKPSKKQGEKVTAAVLEMHKRSEEELKNQIVVLPVYHRGAPHHGKLYKEIFSIQKSFLKYMPYTAFANVLGLPSLTIPVGEDRFHMPIGVQLISKVGNEKALFDLGRIIERKYRGYIRCATYDCKNGGSQN
ncbi:amidase [Ammoniphilus sp. 3BR4]|uniref:amidase n=1 Tax=Ammoniphilus sp. 3BR4 TaxID=3158265 RepID=UPI003467BF07